jgi:molecular chaperone DnaJ
VKIPAGAQSGQKLRLKGQGSPAGKGGKAGDLVLTLRVREHSFFDVRGMDVYCDVVLDKAHVESGTKVRVKTIDGQKVELKIPAGTKDGAVFRLKGLGTRVDGKKGSQFVRIKVKET